jgi:hypothetical protein
MSKKEKIYFLKILIFSIEIYLFYTRHIAKLQVDFSRNNFLSM